jgi:biopolymer transport protein ExbD
MKFLVRKRRAAPAVIIVALIDVLIVLVIFLLVTTTFKQVPSLKLALPESSHSLKPGATENPPLIVTIGPNSEGLRFGDNDMPMTIDQVTAQLKEEASKNPNVKLAVRADKNAPWGTVVEVMDAAKAANIKILSAYTKEAGKQ